MAIPKVKCPFCGGTLESGFLIDQGEGRRVVEWVQGEPEASFWTGVKIAGKARGPVETRRCTDCGYLMLFVPQVK
jgi:hypothetical protein